jgi:Family of unknown function (DUF6209)
MNANRLWLIAVSAAVLAGCAPAPNEDASTTNAATSGVMGTGLYYAAVQAQSASWIQNINLHADGSFEGAFGDSVSNNSGFLSYGDGTYAIDENAKTLTINTAGSTTPAIYDLETVDGGVQLTWSDGGEGNGPFTLVKGPRPASLTFTGDFHTEGSGSLVAGAPLLIEYAAARSTCPVSSSTSEPSVVLEMIVDGQFSQVSVYKLPSRAQGDYYRVLTSVPSGHTLSMWFENETVDSNGNVSCTDWDSNYANNYDFTIASS